MTKTSAKFSHQGSAYKEIPSPEMEAITKVGQLIEAVKDGTVQTREEVDTALKKIPEYQDITLIALRNTVRSMVDMPNK